MGEYTIFASVLQHRCYNVEALSEEDAKDIVRSEYNFLEYDIIDDEIDDLEVED